MASGSYQQVRVICPFFIYDKHMKICCEGYYAQTRIQTCFSTIAQKDIYMKKYCNTYAFNRCCIYRLANEKYKE